MQIAMCYNFEHYVDFRSPQTSSHTYFVTEPVRFIQLSNIIGKVFELLKLKQQQKTTLVTSISYCEEYILVWKNGSKSMFLAMQRIYM